jgi:uncharacterized protein CbrC (UPF0167 family)
MTDTLPSFKYFRDPLAHGCIETSAEACGCCGEKRGFIHSAGMFTRQDPEPRVCPWCIADGRAAAKFTGSFNDGPDRPKDSCTGAEEVMTRTPHVTSWQDWFWPVCCDECCIFLGDVTGKVLLKSRNEAAIDACLAALEEWNFDGTEEELRAIAPGGDPALYLFQCSRCDGYTAVADMS